MRTKIEALFNPVVVIRNYSEEGLRNRLNPLTIEELIAITKAYTPDINRTIYRQKDKEKIIEYIIIRSKNLSKLGQCFRNPICNDTEV